MTSFEYFVCNNHTTCCDCQCGKVWFTRHDDEIEARGQERLKEAEELAAIV